MGQFCPREGFFRFANRPKVIPLGQSYYQDVQHTTEWSAIWDGRTYDLLDYAYTRKNENGSFYSVGLVEGMLASSSLEGEEAAIAFSPGNFVAYEWPWRADMLQTNAGDVWKISYAALRQWDEARQTSSPKVTQGILQVFADEPLSLPAGSFTVRKFTLAGDSAWYARDDTGFPRLVQLDDGMVTYSLILSEK